MKPGVIPNRRSRSTFTQNRGSVRSFFHVFETPGNFRFVSFRDYLDEARAKLKFDRRRLSRSFEDYLLFLFFFFFFGDEGIDLRTREIRINVALWK